MNESEFYRGFAWAVPKAFAAAVHACRFEQGDVLYSDPGAYDTKKRSKHPAPFHIQVLDPPRTNRASANDGEGQRFFSNWESSVTFEWMDYKTGDRRELQSTQGRLFACLWRGESDALLDLEVDGPERPYLLRDLSTRIDASTEALLRELGVSSLASTSDGRKPAKRYLFATAIDLSSDTSRVKSGLIERALAARFEVEVRSFSPVELGIDEADRFHPALEVLTLVIDCSDATKIEDALRDVLYGGGKSAGSDAGRFNVARHGCLLGLA